MYYFPDSLINFLNCDKDKKLKVVSGVERSSFLIFLFFYLYIYIAGIKIFERKTKNGAGESDYRLLQVCSFAIG